MSKAFNYGDTVYSIHGEEAMYLTMAAGGHVVQQVFEQENDEPYYGNAVTWQEVFSKPPVARLHGEIAELEKKADGLRQEIRSMNEQKRQEQQQLGAIQQRYKAIPQLADLDLWLSGACTHIVILGSYSFEVKELKEAIEYKDGYTPSLRLLALYCDPKKENDWCLRMSRYSDGTDRGDTVLLAVSHEDAMIKAEAWFNCEVARCNRRGSGLEHYAIGLARCAIKYGFPVPAELQRKIDEGDAKAKEDRLVQARRDYERARQNLEALEAQP